MKGGVKGKRKRGGGAGDRVYKQSAQLELDSQVPQGWAKGFINQKTKRLIEH